ncbi:hypothetical protein D1872_336540 [compost metagenome]
MCAAVLIDGGSAEADFQVAGEIAGRDGPIFGAAFIVLDPAFDLAGLGVDDARIIGNHRARGMNIQAACSEAQQQ